MEIKTISPLEQLRLKRLRKGTIIADIVFITIGILSAGLGLKSFLLLNDFIDGGVTGISLLVEITTDINLSILIIFINIPFIIMGYKQISRNFAIKTAVAITALAIVIAVVPYPSITDDKLLVAVFGGFFLGAGIGLCMRGGAVIDGTEVAALYLSRTSSLSVGDIILIFNIIIFSVAAIILEIETAMYAILTYFSASRTVDFIIQGIEEYTAVTIISDESEGVRKMITEELGRGVTIYKGRRGFGKRGEDIHDIDIIYSVVTRLEVARLKLEVEKIDPQAFIVQHEINDTRGGMVKKRRLH
ncbi:MAG: YitT family protein [Fimbriimonadaceae bacterium]|nr:YitT family protein [Chitinophagales bacterium]